VERRMRTQVMHTPHSSWREIAARELEKAEALKPTISKWSPCKPAQVTLERARALIGAIKSNDLPSPYGSAGPDGVFCLEWRQPDRKLAFYVYEDGTIDFYVDTPHIKRIEGEIHDGLEKANELVETFLRS
jgi:hypothetical protein